MNIGRTVLASVLTVLWCIASASANLNYKDCPSNSNPIAYDYKLKQIETSEGFLWPDFFISTIPPGSKTYQDAFEAHNLSYALKAFAREDNNFILPLLNRGMLNFYVGNQERAFMYLINAKGVMEDMNQKGFSLGAERSKIFKGESYEQSMACIYMGLLKYSQGDYQNARALFAQAIELDREIVPDNERLKALSKEYASKHEGASESTLADMYHDFGNDNRLAYYMLARAYMKLGDKQNTRISLTNSGNWTAVPDFLKMISCGNAYLPLVNQYDAAPPSENPFVEPTAFEKSNMVMLIQMGSAPEKRVGGADGNKDMITIQPYLPRKAEIYVNGKYLTTAFPMLNLLHQAASLSRTSKDTGQTAKAVGKFFLVALASVVSDDLGRSVQNSWSVAADTRRWGTVPNEIHLATAELPVGNHTISVVFYDKDGKRLKHFDHVNHFVPVQQGEETLLMVRALYDKTNAQEPFYASKVTEFDAGNGLMTFNPMDIEVKQVDEELNIITAAYGDEASTKAFFAKKRYYFINQTVDEPRIRVTKVGTLKVTKISSKDKATGQLVSGAAPEGGTYFVTKGTLVLDEIDESVNQYEK